jgi:hypothetical protein
MDKKDIPKVIQKKYFDVKIETMLPATLTFRVLAEDAEQAVDLIKNMSPTGVQHKLIGRKDKKITVYDAGSTFIKFVKRITGL